MTSQLHLGNMDMQILVIVLFINAKRASLPFGIAVGADLKLCDKEALAVRDYARAHPFEDADPAAISAEAGMPSSLDAEASIPAASGEVTGNGGPSSSAMPDSGMPQAEGSSSGPSIRVHHKHLDQLCKLLCLSERLQSKKTQGHSEMDGTLKHMRGDSSLLVS